MQWSKGGITRGDGSASLSFTLLLGNDQRHHVSPSARGHLRVRSHHVGAGDLEVKYVCKLNGQLVIYEATTGSLCAAVPCVMVGSATPANMPPANTGADPVGFTFKHTMVLVKSDGTIQTKTTDTLKAVFGWDGVDPFWLMDNSEDGGAMRAVEFEIVGGPETGDKGGQYFKSQWLNPLGGGMKTPAAADRRSVLAKYGNKFQALAGVSATTGVGGGQKSAVGGRTGNVSGGTPATTGGTPVPPMPKSPPTAPTATMEEAWAALNEAQPGKSPGEVEKLWFDTIARMFPNKSNTDLKPHEWGRLKVEFADNVPM